MGDPFKKVRSGDPLEVPAETFNTFIDAARDFKARQRSLTRTVQPVFQQTGIVPIRNDSGADRDRFDVLGIGGVVIKPSDNLLEFQNHPALVGVVPDEADHYGRFAVLLEPLRAGAIGRACLSGVCVARLNVIREDHDWADVEDGETDSLKTDDAGGAFILWKEPGSGGNGYGYGYYYYYGDLRWALVRMSNLSDGDPWGTV